MWGWTPHHGRIEVRARMELSHSGAFELGAGTNVVILPSAVYAQASIAGAVRDAYDAGLRLGLHFGL